MELSRIIDPNFGLLVWSALDVVSVDIAVASLHCQVPAELKAARMASIDVPHAKS
jgi:hypothetical protein